MVHVTIKGALGGKASSVFLATGTVATERMQGEATVVVEDLGDGTARLVTHDKQVSTIGGFVVRQYCDANRALVDYTAEIPRVAAPTDADPADTAPAPTDADAATEVAPATTTPGKLVKGVELTFDVTCFVPADGAKAEATKQEVFN